MDFVFMTSIRLSRVYSLNIISTFAPYSFTHP